MNTEFLDQSENASTRAQILMKSGAYDEARKAFVEAADAMLRFSDGQQGQRKTDAQQIVEILLRKAKEAKEKADGETASASSARSAAAEGRTAPHDAAETAETAAPSTPVPVTPPAAPPAPKPKEKAQNDNRSAINRDIQSYQKSAAGKGSFGGRQSR